MPSKKKRKGQARKAAAAKQRHQGNATNPVENAKYLTTNSIQGEEGDECIPTSLKNKSTSPQSVESPSKTFKAREQYVRQCSKKEKLLNDYSKENVSEGLESTKDEDSTNLDPSHEEVIAPRSAIISVEERENQSKTDGLSNEELPLGEDVEHVNSTTDTHQKEEIGGDKSSGDVIERTFLPNEESNEFISAREEVCSSDPNLDTEHDTGEKEDKEEDTSTSQKEEVGGNTSTGDDIDRTVLPNEEKNEYIPADEEVSSSDPNVAKDTESADAHGKEEKDGDKEGGNSLDVEVIEDNDPELRNTRVNPQFSSELIASLELARMDTPPEIDTPPEVEMIEDNDSELRNTRVNPQFSSELIAALEKNRPDSVTEKAVNTLNCDEIGSFDNDEQGENDQDEAKEKDTGVSNDVIGSTAPDHVNRSIEDISLDKDEDTPYDEGKISPPEETISLDSNKVETPTDNGPEFSVELCAALDKASEALKTELESSQYPIESLENDASSNQEQVSPRNVGGVSFAENDASPNQELYQASKLSNNSTNEPINKSLSKSPGSVRKLVSSKGVYESGSALIRTMGKSFLKKSWTRIYWIRYGEASLYIFGSKRNYEKWLTSPKNFKHRYAFLEEMNTDKSIQGFKCSDIKENKVKRKGKILHTFKIEKWTSNGVRNVVAFASESEDETDALKHSIEVCLTHCPDGGMRKTLNA